MDGPDGSWAWAVAFAACLINFIIAGLGRISGILYVAFIDLFHVDRQGSSVPFSIRSSMRNLLGPVVGILGQKYSVRAITITGGIIGTVSAAACFYAHDILWLSVLWGGLNGAGTAFTTTLPQVVISQYFIKYRTTASGMAFSGGCVGSFLFPVLIEYLLLEYGLEGTFLIIGGIIMHVIPCAMVLKKPPWIKESSKDGKIANVKQETTIPGYELTPENLCPDDVKVTHKHYLEDEPDVRYLQKADDIVLQLFKVVEEPLQTNKTHLNTPSDSCILDEMKNLYISYLKTRNELPITGILSSGNGSEAWRLESADNSSYQKGSIFKSDDSLKINNLQDMNSHQTYPVPDMNREFNVKRYIYLKLRLLANHNQLELVSSFPEQERFEAARVLNELKKLHTLCSKTAYNVSENLKRNQDNIPDRKSEPHSNTYWDHVKTAIKLYRNPLFLLICLCRSVHFITFIPVITCVVDFSMDKGLLEQDGKYVIGALSLGDLLGRLCLGWITDRRLVTLPQYMLIVMVLQGVSAATLPFIKEKWMLLAGIALFGMLQGSVFIRHPVLVNKYMGRNEQSIAMGCINLFSGFLGFAIPSYIGYFRDYIGSYDNIFYINGSIGAFIGILWIFEPYLVRYSSSKQPDDDFPECI